MCNITEFAKTGNSPRACWSLDRTSSFGPVRVFTVRYPIFCIEFHRLVAKPPHEHYTHAHTHTHTQEHYTQTNTTHAPTLLDTPRHIRSIQKCTRFWRRLPCKSTPESGGSCTNRMHGIPTSCVLANIITSSRCEGMSA